MRLLRKVGIGAGILFVSLVVIGAAQGPQPSSVQLVASGPSNPKVLGDTTKTSTPSQPTPSLTPVSTPALTPTPTPKPVAIAKPVTPKPIVRMPTPAPPKPVVAPSSCDPNYSGACVPIASDVDCADGTGNGPAYVTGPVRIIGADIYKLDSNSNGWGCE